MGSESAPAPARSRHPFIWGFGLAVGVVTGVVFAVILFLVLAGVLVVGAIDAALTPDPLPSVTGAEVIAHVQASYAETFPAITFGEALGPPLLTRWTCAETQAPVRRVVAVVEPANPADGPVWSVEFLTRVDSGEITIHDPVNQATGEPALFNDWYGQLIAWRDSQVLLVGGGL